MHSRALVVFPSPSFCPCLCLRSSTSAATPAALQLAEIYSLAVDTCHSNGQGSAVIVLMQFQQRCDNISSCATFLGVTSTTGCADALALHEPDIISATLLLPFRCLLGAQWLPCRMCTTSLVHRDYFVKEPPSAAADSIAPATCLPAAHTRSALPSPVKLLEILHVF